jgi:hypothetical protein
LRVAAAIALAVIAVGLFSATTTSQAAKTDGTGSGDFAAQRPSVAQGTGDSNDVHINPYVFFFGAPALGLIGVIVGRLLPEYFARRRRVAALYDGAIAALARAEADRHGAALNVPRALTGATTQDAHEEIVQQLSTDGTRRFLESAADARAALATLHPYSPDLKAYWDRFDVTSDEFDALVALLARRKAKPLKRYATASEPA